MSKPGCAFDPISQSQPLQGTMGVLHGTPRRGVWMGGSKQHKLTVFVLVPYAELSH